MWRIDRVHGPLSPSAAFGVLAIALFASPTTDEAHAIGRNVADSCTTSHLLVLTELAPPAAC